MQYNSLILFLVIFEASGTLIIHSPPEIQGTYEGYVLLPHNLQYWESSSPAIFGTAATSLNVLQATGGILFAPRISAFLVNELQRYQAKYLPRAIIMQTPVIDSSMELGFNDYALETFSAEELALLEAPILLIDTFKFDTIFSSLGFNKTAEVEVNFSPNPWRIIASSPAWWLISSSLLAFMVASMVFIIVRLASFVRAKGFQFSIAQVVLLILLLTTARNFVAWIVDGGRTFRNTSVFVQIAVSEIPTGMATLSALLTIFFLHEIVSLASIRVTTFVSKLKVPAIIAAIILMFLQFWVFMARSVFTVYAAWLDLLSAVYDLAVSVGVILYFAYVTSIFLKRVAKAKTQNLQKSLTDMLSIIFALLLRLIVYVVVIGAYFGPAPNFFFSAAGFRYFLWAQHTTIQVLVFTLANMFKLPGGQSKPSTTTASTQRNASTNWSSSAN